MEDYPFPHSPAVFGNHHQTSIIQLKNTNLNDSLFKNDAEFEWLYPEHFQLMSQKHWTPLAIARKAAGFLAEPDAKVLDIGSGVGKFCLAAGYYFPETFFHGVEQRHELIHSVEEAKAYLKSPNVNFIYANITQVNFKEFDH